MKGTKELIQQAINESFPVSFKDEKKDKALDDIKKSKFN